MMIWDWMMAADHLPGSEEQSAPRQRLVEIVKRRVERSEQQIRELEGRQRAARVLEMYPR